MSRKFCACAMAGAQVQAGVVVRDDRLLNRSALLPKMPTQRVSMIRGPLPHRPIEFWAFWSDHDLNFGHALVDRSYAGLCAGPS